MARKKQQVEEQAQQTVIEGATREEVYKLSAEYVRGLAEGTSWLRSAVEHRDGCFRQTITVINS